MISNKYKFLNQTYIFQVSLRSIIAFIMTAQFFICLLAIHQAQASELPKKTEVCDLFFTGNIQLHDIPIARTTEQRKKGLSNRQDAGVGMLFSFEPPSIARFWMKDTYVPLSVGFISEEGRLFAIEALVPESEDLHPSTKPIRYALELPKGQFEQHGLGVGAKLIKTTCRLI